MLRASRHREVDGKSNEITAVPELLGTLHLDAMGCQKDDIARVTYQKRPFLIPLAVGISGAEANGIRTVWAWRLSSGHCR
ncbi:MAG: hypothetical protein JOZ17_06165, partial [Acetobacteraceae bacterium]|nr:hypothetical protein [Acetobacteraceae bacterium]